MINLYFKLLSIIIIVIIINTLIKKVFWTLSMTHKEIIHVKLTSVIKGEKNYKDMNTEMFVVLICHCI